MGSVGRVSPGGPRVLKWDGRDLGLVFALNGHWYRIVRVGGSAFGAQVVDAPAPFVVAEGGRVMEPDEPIYSGRGKPPVHEGWKYSTSIKRYVRVPKSEEPGIDPTRAGDPAKGQVD